MKGEVEETEKLVKSILDGILAKKGLDVVKIDLRGLGVRIADYFIVCHGTSTTQVNALCDSVEDVARLECGEKPLHVEGLENCYWVLLDYSNVIVHIFLEEYRNFYDIESLWSDALIEKVEDKKA